MDTFSKYANLYITITRNIIESAINSGVISERDLNEIIKKHGVSEDNYDFLKALVGKSDEDNKFHGISILEPVGMKTYRSKIKNLPLILSKSERSALIESLSSEIASAFISDEMLTRFGLTARNSILAETLGKVISAIRTKKWIVFDNIAGDGKLYANQHLKPQKIEHSLATGDYFVSGYCKESMRLIKCNLKRITIHNIENSEDVDKYFSLLEKRCCEPICLSIVNEKNAIDRAFNMFSVYEKDGFYNKREDNYILNIYYYEFKENLAYDLFYKNDKLPYQNKQVSNRFK